MKNIKKLYDELFGMEQDGKMREKVFFARITASVAVMLLCMAAMCMSAYAFFTSSVTSEMNTIRAANYELEISAPDGLESTEDGYYVLDGNIIASDEGATNGDEESANAEVPADGGDETPVTDSGEGAVVTAESGGTEQTSEESDESGENLTEQSEAFAQTKTYSFTLKPTADSTASVGYCKIEITYNGETKYCYTQPIWLSAEGATSEIEKVTERTVEIVVPDGASVNVKFISEWGSCTQMPIDNNTVDLTDWENATVFFTQTEQIEDDTTTGA